MFHDAHEYETRAAECERLAYATTDLVLREEILSLSRIYLDFAEHLRRRFGENAAAEWKRAAND